MLIKFHGSTAHAIASAIVGALLLGQAPAFAAEPVDNLSQLAEVQIESILIEGNTVLPVAEVDALTQPLEGRLVRLDELHDLRHALSELYVKHGYISSGVIIPDQRVNQGVITLQAIEGTLSQVNVDGTDRLRDGYIARRLKKNHNQPLNVAELQDALRELQMDPRIRQVNAQLEPGIENGESTLMVEVKENRAWNIVVGVDNHHSPSVDENRTSLGFVHKNLTGFGDELAIAAGLTEGLDDYSASYAFPLTANDLVLKAYFGKTDSEIVEEPFDRIDITSVTETAGFTLTRPFWRNPEGSMTASLGLENKRSESTLLGIPFSLSAGENSGIAEASIIAASVNWVRRSSNQVLAIRGSVRFGIDAMGATINTDAPDSEFVSLLGQVQYVRRLPWRNSEFIARSTLQIALDPLLAFEKFSVGGHATVRGYRENFYVRDNGFVTSAELHFPLFVDESGVSKHNIKMIAFADFGLAWDDDDTLSSSSKDDIYSVGLGLQWNPAPTLDFQLFYGEALKSVNNAGTSLQEDGVQFRVSYFPGKHWK
jgi:hemolysin activation/secretion protein